MLRAQSWKSIADNCCFDATCGVSLENSIADISGFVRLPSYQTMRVSKEKVQCLRTLLCIICSYFRFHHQVPSFQPPLEPSWRTELEPIDTTHEGFEKYLDPYLTTSRLHHRPYTAEQLQRPSCNKDVVTYYTFKDISYVSWSIGRILMSPSASVGTFAHDLAHRLRDRCQPFSMATNGFIMFYIRCMFALGSQCGWPLSFSSS